MTLNERTCHWIKYNNPLTGPFIIAFFPALIKYKC